MSSAQVTLHGRFDPGAHVTLVKVASERTLRAEGSEAIDSRAADDRGTVTFDAGVELGARYIASRSAIVTRLRSARAARRASTRRHSSRFGPTAPHELRRPIDQPTAETSARRQEGINAVPQRSDIRTGTATPVD